MHNICFATMDKLLSYCPETGVLTWKTRSRDMFEGRKYDAERLCKAWNARYAGQPAGCDNGSGYLVVQFESPLLKVRLKAHRIAMCFILGHDFDHYVDHINGNTRDNRKCNLRLADRSINARNTARKRAGVAGVVWHSRTQKWQAQLWNKGKNVYLGRFKSREEAVSARLAGEEKYWGLNA